MHPLSLSVSFLHSNDYPCTFKQDKIHQEKILFRRETVIGWNVCTEKVFITNEEYAKGIRYNNIMKTTWRPPYKYRMKPKNGDLVREKYNIQIQSDSETTGTNF